MKREQVQQRSTPVSTKMPDPIIWPRQICTRAGLLSPSNLVCHTQGSSNKGLISIVLRSQPHCTVLTKSEAASRHGVRTTVRSAGPNTFFKSCTDWCRADSSICASDLVRNALSRTCAARRG